MNLQLSLSGDKGAYYVAESAGVPAGELGSRNGGDERKSDILAPAGSLAVCWYNGTLRGRTGEFLQCPITAAAISPLCSPPHSGPITNSYT